MTGGISWPSLGCRGAGGAGPRAPAAGGTMAPGGGKDPEEGKGRGGKCKSWDPGKLGRKSRMPCVGGCGPMGGKSLRDGPGP